MFLKCTGSGECREGSQQGGEVRGGSRERTRSTAVCVLKIILCVCVPRSMYVCIQCMCLMPKESRTGYRFPGTGVTDDSELPCGCWELNLGPLEEQPVRLATEPSLWAILVILSVHYTQLEVLRLWFPESEGNNLYELIQAKQ